MFRCIFSFVLLCLSGTVAHTQSIDRTFNLPTPLKGADIHAIKVFPDGKMLLAGAIVQHGNTKVSNLIRINADGTLDNSFLTDLPRYFKVDGFAVQSSGDIIAYFGSSQVSTRTELIWISPKGTIKKKLSLPKHLLEFIKVQPDDDKVLIGGWNDGRGVLKRFNADLTEDTEFNAHTNFDQSVLDAAIQNGQIVVVGYFTLVNGVDKKYLARLNPDGTLDDSFVTGSGPNSAIGSVAVQEDAKVVLGESYMTRFNGTTTRGIVRLNFFGSVDTSFQPPILASPTGKVKVSGRAVYVTAGNQLLQLRENGQTESTFTPITLKDLTAAQELVYDLDFERNIVLCNYHEPEFGIVKFDIDGQIMPAFKPEIANYGDIFACDTLGTQFIIGGNFVRLGNFKTNNLARVNMDGSVDPAFKTTSQFNEVIQIDAQDEEHIFVSTGNSFFKTNGTGEVLLTADLPDSYTVGKFKTLKDGKIICADDLHVFRLDVAGNIDPSFDTGEGAGNYSNVYDLDVQSTGKVIYAGTFKTFDNITVNRIVRLNVDGSVDETFKTGTGFDGRVAVAQVLEDDELLVCGYFESFDNLATPGNTVRLNADGVPDNTFIQNLGTWNYFRPDLTRSFKDNIYWNSSGYTETETSFTIARSHSDGTEDIGFYIPVEQDVNINSINELAFAQDALFILGETEEQGHEPEFMTKVRVAPVTAVEEALERPVITVYPVPARDKVFIASNPVYKDQQFDITVRDMTGKPVLYTKNIVPDEVPIHLDTLPAGCYSLFIQNSRVKAKPVRIVKF